MVYIHGVCPLCIGAAHILKSVEERSGSRIRNVYFIHASACASCGHNYLIVDELCK